MTYQSHAILPNYQSSLNSQNHQSSVKPVCGVNKKSKKIEFIPKSKEEPKNEIKKKVKVSLPAMPAEKCDFSKQLCKSAK